MTYYTRTADFHYELPEELIARYPAAERGDDRLMLLRRPRDSGRERVEHHLMGEIADLLPEGSLLVFNDSRVRKARLYGRAEGSESVKGAQFLLTKPRDNEGAGDRAGDRHLWEALTTRLDRKKPGKRFIFDGGAVAEIAANEGGLVVLRFDRPLDEEWFEAHGHVPLPPYIRREDEQADSDRYQTIYARETGSAAAPTAGLHWTDAIFRRLEERGISRVFLTLHVGLGTFHPVREEFIADHKMHEEEYTIGEECATAIEAAKREGRPVVAVGTTSLRTLESAWEADTGKLRRGAGRTSIFIYPPWQFHVADALFTNFHTPCSTLLMLTAAFAGCEALFRAYREAVRERYRFFSYGDAMLVV